MRTESFMTFSFSDSYLCVRKCKDHFIIRIKCETLLHLGIERYVPRHTSSKMCELEESDLLSCPPAVVVAVVDVVADHQRVTSQQVCQIPILRQIPASNSSSPLFIPLRAHSSSNKGLGDYYYCVCVLFKIPIFESQTLQER